DTHAAGRGRGQHQRRLRRPRRPGVARPVAHRDAPRPHLGRVRGVAARVVPALRPQARRRAPLRHRHRRSGGALQPPTPVARMVRGGTPHRPRRRGLGLRNQGGPAAGSRRRPPAQRLGLAPPLWRPAGRGGFRHRHDLRRGGRGGRLPRRRHLAGHQPVHRGAAPSGRAPAADRHRPPAGCDRPRHGGRDAVRDVLGLHRHDRRHHRPHPRRAGPAQGGGDGRPRPALQRRHDIHRSYRPGHHARRPPTVGESQPSPNLHGDRSARPTVYPRV
ncbi:MAG: Pantothenate kinase type III, CoaX-like, partial [uncultured Acetobacteraceae bacterium]